MLGVHILNVTQPEISKTHAIAIERRLHTTTTIVTRHHDVAYFQHLGSELQHRQTIKIGMHHHVAHIPVHEHLARQQTDDLVSRHTRIRATNPEIFGCLQLRQFLEIVAVNFAHALGPGTIEVKQMQQIFVTAGVFFPVPQIQYQKLRAFNGRGVVGRRLKKTQITVHAHGDPHGRQGVHHQALISRCARCTNRCQGKLFTNPETPRARFDI